MPSRRCCEGCYSILFEGISTPDCVECVEEGGATLVQWPDQYEPQKQVLADLWYPLSRNKCLKTTAAAHDRLSPCEGAIYAYDVERETDQFKVTVANGEFTLAYADVVNQDDFMEELTVVQWPSFSCDFTTAKAYLTTRCTARLSSFPQIYAIFQDIIMKSGSECACRQPPTFQGLKMPAFGVGIDQFQLLFSDYTDPYNPIPPAAFECGYCAADLEWIGSWDANFEQYDVQCSVDLKYGIQLRGTHTFTGTGTVPADFAPTLHSWDRVRAYFESNPVVCTFDSEVLDDSLLEYDCSNGKVYIYAGQRLPDSTVPPVAECPVDQTCYYRCHSEQQWTRPATITLNDDLLIRAPDLDELVIPAGDYICPPNNDPDKLCFYQRGEFSVGGQTVVITANITGGYAWDVAVGWVEKAQSRGRVSDSLDFATRPYVCRVPGSFPDPTSNFPGTVDCNTFTDTWTGLLPTDEIGVGTIGISVAV